jgi:hypothetical protein
MQLKFIFCWAMIALTACVPKSEHQKVEVELNAKVSELEQEKAKAKQFQDELQKAKAEIQKLSDAATKRDAEVAKLKNELFASATELTAAKEGLQKELAKKPRLPVNVSFRAALLGDGHVIQIFNDASEPLPIRLFVKRPATDTTKDFELVLPGNATAEFGHAEGWGFHAGDIAVLKNNAYEEVQTVLK